MLSKISTRLCGVATCRRNFRQGFAGSKRVVEIFDKTFRGRNAPSKFSTRPFRVETRRRNFRQGFARSQCVVEIFDKILGFPPPPSGTPLCLARHFNAGIPDLKACPAPGLNPVQGGMGAIPIPAMNRRAMHGVETPTRRADSQSRQ